MDTSQVEQDLCLRIEQSREWVESESPTIPDISFRNHQWTAIAREFLDDKGRVERHGVKFDFVLNDPAKKLKVQLCIRIKPKLTEGKKEDSPPFVVIYVVNQVTKVEDCVAFHKIAVASSYQDLVGLPIDEWYRRWFRFALGSESKAKVMALEMRITD
jgi:hypothetical protein